MISERFYRPAAAIVVPLALAVSLSGCTLLGLGAAAGAAVGGCAVLDENEDEMVTEAELSEGLFNAWDVNGDDALVEAEFEAGIERSDLYSDWSGEFDAWDTNDSGELSESEFASGVAQDENVPRWLDRRCDDLGL